MPLDITRFIFTLISSLVFFCQPASADGSSELTVGIVPQQSATALAAAWIPMLSEAAKRAGVKLAFRTAGDIPTFEQRLKNGEYDIAYMNPYHYTVFSKAPGYRAFAREKGRKLVGIVVVAKDSPLHDLAELNGKAVVFPAPAAFAASILPRAEFDQKNIPIQAKYVNSHDSVYRGVAQGTFAAGGGIKRTLEALDPAISSRLRILASTPAYVPHAFAAHPRVDKALLDKVSAAFFSLNGDETGRQLLEPLSFKGIEAGQDKDWDEIRRLKINLPTGLPSNP
ncbi:MAG: phosphate/phosphite/phosphonate ABC transporter substrate-binding protein [Dechloromonas sp.]|jgi:phosphonate transport system substrate-binding protein|uniref:Phosphate/phosphite/phosphonate ABC transporter substrate-binding protein n=1 Tax=Candidatus Dechloromonas phosphorivorans TaxID=2899244 RepID=A0A935JUD1_9RHOO|nr:phosphate/phosphite/phosphonate ABC transporter substrate-binding protein [Candidatus Dechloromonas phosphorivorans]